MQKCVNWNSSSHKVYEVKNLCVVNNVNCELDCCRDVEGAVVDKSEERSDYQYYEKKHGVKVIEQ